VVIILCLYIVAMRLLFSKLKLVRWGWLSWTMSVSLPLSLDSDGIADVAALRFCAISSQSR
jgi:hypothetical protein